MKSISLYFYSKRYLLFDILFWGFWFLNLCVYIGEFENTFSSGAIAHSTGNILVIYGFYRLISFLMKRFFEDSKYLIYILLVLVIGGEVRLIMNEVFWQLTLKYLDFGTFNSYYNNMVNIEGVGFYNRVKRFGSLFGFIVFFQFQRLFIIALKLMFDFTLELKKNNALEKNRSDLEIKLLKSQINPKFIDETLENIKKTAKNNPEKAELMTLKLSNATRYTFYETDVEKVPLQKELDFLIHYIDLQETRLTDQANINLRLKTNALDGLTISPLLVFPMLEKAFRCIKSQCDIDIKVRESVLELKIESDTVPNCQHTGVENTQKRLEALYPNKYRLQVVEIEENFKIDLKLEL